MTEFYLLAAGVLALVLAWAVWICRPCDLCRRWRNADRPMSTLNYDHFENCCRCRTCGAYYVGRVDWGG